MRSRLAKLTYLFAIAVAMVGWSCFCIASPGRLISRRVVDSNAQSQIRIIHCRQPLLVQTRRTA